MKESEERKKEKERKKYVFSEMIPERKFRKKKPVQKRLLVLTYICDRLPWSLLRTPVHYLLECNGSLIT